MSEENRPLANRVNDVVKTNTILTRQLGNLCSDIVKLKRMLKEHIECSSSKNVLGDLHWEDMPKITITRIEE